jgi:hypothetical protein
MSSNETPNVRFYFQDADGTQQVVSSRQLEFEEIEFARTEPLPDPVTLTVGDMIKIFALLSGTPPEWRRRTSVGVMLSRREKLLSASPGWRVFQKWAQRKHGCHVTIEIAQAFRGELCRLLGKDFDEIEALPLLESVHQLEHPETVSPPAASGEDTAPAAVAASRRHHHHRRRRRLRRIKDESPAAVTPSGTVTPETASPRPPHREEKPGAAPAWGTEAKPSSNTKQKRRRAPRRISKVQMAIAILNFRAKNARESIRVDDIAKEADCTPQNLYKSPDFQSVLKSSRARRYKRGWKIDGVADCPDDSTLDVG